MRGKFKVSKRLKRRLCIAGHLVQPGEETPVVSIPKHQRNWLLTKIRKGHVKFTPARKINRKEGGRRKSATPLKDGGKDAGRAKPKITKRNLNTIDAKPKATSEAKLESTSKPKVEEPPAPKPQPKEEPKPEVEEQDSPVNNGMMPIEVSEESIEEPVVEDAPTPEPEPELEPEPEPEPEPDDDDKGEEEEDEAPSSEGFYSEIKHMTAEELDENYLKKQLYIMAKNMGMHVTTSMRKDEIIKLILDD